MKDELNSRTIMAVLRNECFEKINEQKNNTNAVDEGDDEMDLIWHDENRM